MTRKDYESLPDGTRVWYRQDFFAFPILGTIRHKDGQRGVWVNFFGYCQGLFADEDNHEGNHKCCELFDNKEDNTK